MAGNWGKPGGVSSSSSCCSVPHGQAMFTERIGAVELISRPEGRVALAGTLLAFLQSFGLVLSLYMLVSNYLVEEEEENPYVDPTSNLCTEAALCLFFRYGPLHNQVGETHMGLAGQMLYSLIAVAVNLLLVGGALARRPFTFLPWLVLYGLAVPGALVLAIIVPLTVIFRDRDFGDNDINDFAWFLVPLLLCIAYAVLWLVVFQVFSQLRKLQATVYSLSP